MKNYINKEFSNENTIVETFEKPIKIKLSELYEFDQLKSLSLADTINFENRTLLKIEVLENNVNKESKKIKNRGRVLTIDEKGFIKIDSKNDMNNEINTKKDITPAVL